YPPNAAKRCVIGSKPNPWSSRETGGETWELLEDELTAAEVDAKEIVRVGHSISGVAAEEIRGRRAGHAHGARRSDGRRDVAGRRDLRPDAARLIELPKIVEHHPLRLVSASTEEKYGLRFLVEQERSVLASDRPVR